MKKLLVSLWAVGAVLYTVNTLFIVGWLSSGVPKGVASGDETAKDAVVQSEAAAPAAGHDKDASEDKAAAQQSASAPASQPATAEGDRMASDFSESAKTDQQPPSGDVAAASPNNADQSAEPASAPPAAIPSTAAAGNPDQQTSADERQQHEDEWAQVSRKDALVRSGPSDSAPTILAYPVGRKVRIVGRQGDFVQVEDGLSGQVGWMEGGSLGLDHGSPKQSARADTGQNPATKTPSDSGTAVALNHAANLRSDASPGARTMRSYPAGTELRELGREGGWVQVSNPATGETGWIYEQFIGAPGTQAAVPRSSANAHTGTQQSHVSASSDEPASAPPPQRRNREAFAERSRPRVAAPDAPDKWQPPPVPDEEEDAADSVPWQRSGGPLRRIFGGGD